MNYCKKIVRLVSSQDIRRNAIQPPKWRSSKRLRGSSSSWRPSCFVGHSSFWRLPWPITSSAKTYQQKSIETLISFLQHSINGNSIESNLFRRCGRTASIDWSSVLFLLILGKNQHPRSSKILIEDSIRKWSKKSPKNRTARLESK